MSFLNALTEAQDGGVVLTLDERFRELLAAVLEHKAKGVMTIKCTLSPDKRDGRGNVVMAHLGFSIKVDKPALQPGGALFFVTDEQELVRNPPGQDELFSERKVKKHAE